MPEYKLQIGVDHEVFKALTAFLDAEGKDHNDVLREMLKLDSPVEAETPAPFLPALDGIARSLYGPAQFYSRGLVLPNGTELQARHKGRHFSAAIVDGKWIDQDGTEHSSPSAAASAITGNSVNGWRFWEARLPGEGGWRRLDIIQGSQRA